MLDFIKGILDFYKDILRQSSEMGFEYKPYINFGKFQTNEDSVTFSGSFNFSPRAQDKYYRKSINSVSRVVEELGGSFKVVDYLLPFYTPEKSNLCQSIDRFVDEQECFFGFNTYSAAGEFTNVNIEAVAVGTW